MCATTNVLGVVVLKCIVVGDLFPFLDLDRSEDAQAHLLTALPPKPHHARHVNTRLIGMVLSGWSRTAQRHSSAGRSG